MYPYVSVVYKLENIICSLYTIGDFKILRQYLPIRAPVSFSSVSITSNFDSTASNCPLHCTQAVHSAHAPWPDCICKVLKQ